MSFRSLRHVVVPICLVFPCLVSGSVSISYQAVEEFRDFTIHGLFHQEQARELLDNQIQSFWKRRMQDLLPVASNLEIHFKDIDMAGEMRPIPQAGQSYTRVVKDEFPPRLDFDYRIYSSDEEVLAEGSVNLLGKDFSFRNRRRPAPGEATFFHELELLYGWLEKLEIPAVVQGKERT